MVILLFRSSRFGYLFPPHVLFYRSGSALVCLYAQEASNAINVWTEIGCPIQTQ